MSHDDSTIPADLNTPTKDEILKAIKDGVWMSFPYADLILAAISDGCREGVVLVHEQPRHKTVQRQSRPRIKKESIPYELRWSVFERDNFTCKKCGTRKHLSADHIVPESKGGKTIKSNLQTLCRTCNSKKGAR